MVDTLDRTRVVAAPKGVESDSIERLEFADAPAERAGYLHLPILRGFAFLAGGGLTTLGLLGLMPWFTANGVLLGLFQVTPQLSLIHLVTGLAGLAAWRLRRESLAFAYAIALTAVYILVFSDGNLIFGNAVGMFASDANGTTIGAGEPTLLGLVALRQLPQMMINGFHITLAMVAFFAASAAAMMAGARATIRQRGPYIRVYHSRTRIRAAA